MLPSKGGQVPLHRTSSAWKNRHHGVIGGKVEMQLGCSASAICLWKSPGVLAEQGADEIFGLLCNLLKAFLIKLPLCRCNQSQGLCIAVTLEWRLTTQPEEKDRQRCHYIDSSNLHPVGGVRSQQNTTTGGGSITIKTVHLSATV